ncbi:LysR family transcriptional regulator [Levilactobacillus acidifarinae]|uniref:HTH lysR-type domain-containing protein n=1 Tax=Levilactobacillus acidifarinae DSM 19394 = JCM 15949 TaxID=1423715 RepID=A0A0R1LNY7_9LACO|nr:LysR family transcriptional regulator [Levilactobacillus acidifarinae]KRK93898.1 hypothetical protein FD25_GL001225 [Levilactobacillus acidifarinae DSM 19394]GEO68786.1 LysR family transcriptional regulator [Levilactobacillus acidifarinae]
MEIQELITFQTIAATRNFSKAAQLLGYTQSAVSMQMRHLEAELGSKLFDYRRRQVQITVAGTQLLPLVERTLANVASIRQLGAQSSTATLRVAAPESLTISLVAAALHQVQQATPQLQITLQNATCRHNEEVLLRGDVDVAFMLWPSRPSARLTDHDLGEQEMVLVTAQPMTWQQLLADSQATLMTNEPECSYRNQFETSAWQQHQRQFRTLSLPSIAAIKASVISDLGFSYLPRAMVERELAEGQLTVVPTDIVNHIHAHVLTSPKTTNPAVTALLTQVEAATSQAKES